MTSKSLDNLLTALFPERDLERPKVKKSPARPPKLPPHFDFRNSGPLMPMCALCNKRFQDWAVPDDDWRKLPEMYWRCQLCKDDYREVLRDAGHDPEKVTISDDPWLQRVALWEKTKDLPPDHAFVLLKGRRGKSSEIRECQVIRQIDEIAHVVRVFKKKLVKRSRGKGTRYLASWSKMHYCRASGRPIMVALGRLPRRQGMNRPESIAGKKENVPTFSEFLDFVLANAGARTEG